MILYGSSFSPFVRKVMAYAAEKGLAIEAKNIGLGSEDADFKRASPFNKMPAFVDGEFAISDSTAIITYLEAKHPSPSLLPADPADRARVIWFEEFADSIMAEVVAKCFFNRVVAPKFLKMPGDEAVAVEGETVHLPKVLDYFETVAPAADGFLVGKALTLADIAVASPFINFAHAKCAVDKTKYPRTFAWVDAMHARPSFAEIIAMEHRVLERIG